MSIPGQITSATLSEPSKQRAILLAFSSCCFILRCNVLRPRLAKKQSKGLGTAPIPKLKKGRPRIRHQKCTIKFHKLHYLYELFSTMPTVLQELQTLINSFMIRDSHTHHCIAVTVNVFGHGMHHNICTQKEWILTRKNNGIASSN